MSPYLGQDLFLTDCLAVAKGLGRHIIELDPNSVTAILKVSFIALLKDNTYQNLSWRLHSRLLGR